jgi:hypothetical protein
MLSFPRTYCYILLILGFTPVHAQSLGGLKFHGSERSIDQRTSYNVFGEKAPEFSNNFDVEFDLSLYATTQFGYILRIKNDENNSIYNLFYDGQGGSLVFRLNEEGKSILLTSYIEREELLNQHWFRMKISFDLKNDSIIVSINNHRSGVGHLSLPDIFHPTILFGRSEHIIDVPSFAIKDLAVGDQDKYLFELKESKGNDVHDMRGNSVGRVINPEWLINDAYHWRSHTSFRSQSVAGANYNPEKKEIYYFNKDTLFVYNVRSEQLNIKVFEHENPVRLKLGTNFIDTEKNKLYSYEPYVENYNGPTVASLDLGTWQWTAEDVEQLVSPLHHHGSYFDKSTGQYTIFGGFGRMYFSSDFYTYDTKTHQWDTLKGFTGDYPLHRYFSSVGYSEDSKTLFIFGGMGNESGEQTVGRKYYYDLHKVDLNTKVISKLWEIPWKQDNMVPVRGMVLTNDSFYTLCYPEHVSKSLLRLYKFSLKDGKYEVLGDSIPIRSDKIATNANLYYDSALNRLFALVQEFDDDISSELKVYSLASPPITAEELASFSAEKSRVPWLIILLASSVVAALGYLLYRRSTSQKQTESNEDGEFIPHGKIEDKHRTVARPNSIYLFGDFTVFDRKNRNITYMFSAQLKQIFCLVLQYSTTEGGIASQRLSSILWPDKPADKVKNSRGVTLNHLRKVLSELDGIELLYDKGYFKIEQKQQFYCDYSRCMQIISSNEEEKYRDELVDILSRGKFLQLSDHPLYDSFKEEMEKKLEPVLLVEIEKSFASELYETTIAFAEAITNIDPLNDTALAYQIKAMQRLKMSDEAKIRYQAFVIEYKKAMGNDYPHPYKSFTSPAA